MSELTNGAKRFISVGLHKKHPLATESHINGLCSIVENQEKRLAELEADKYMEEHHHIADSTIGLATAYLERGNPAAALDILRISQDKLTAITIKYRPLTAEAFGLTQKPTGDSNDL
jgi:hypothetical protein